MTEADRRFGDMDSIPSRRRLIEKPRGRIWNHGASGNPPPAPDLLSPRILTIVSGAVSARGARGLPEHRTEIRVRYADTDQGGVVYNANYLVFFEVGRTEMMREMGLPYAALEDRGIMMPVVESHVNYLAPARYDDLLVIESKLSELRRVRIKIETRVFKKDTGTVLAEGWIWLACTERGEKVIPLPEDLKEVFASGN